MAFSEHKPTGSKPEPDRGSCGQKLYSKMARMFREGFVSIVIYKNKYERACYYDIVFYRKVRSNGKSEYRRGANYKPTDMPDLAVLLPEVEAFFASLPDGYNRST